jgi:hypothetical protein
VSAVATHRAAFRFGPVRGDRLVEELILVLRGTPSAVDDELDSILGGIRRRCTQGVEQIGVEVDDAGILLVEDGRAIRHRAVGLGDGAVRERPSRDRARHEAPLRTNPRMTMPTAG